MNLFKLIEIDLDTIRADARKPRKYNQRQRRALLKLYDLFEAGKWKECLKHAQSEKAFPRNKRGEYPEQEHIAIAVINVLQSLGSHNFYTQSELLDQARERLAKEPNPEMALYPKLTESLADLFICGQMDYRPGLSARKRASECLREAEKLRQLHQSQRKKKKSCTQS